MSGQVQNIDQARPTALCPSIGLKMKLLGATLSDGTHHSSIEYRDKLKIEVSNLVGPLINFEMPDVVVDLVILNIYDKNGLKVTSKYAWLCEDGTVKDFLTGTSNNILFCEDINSTDLYFIEIKQKNHLSIVLNLSDYFAQGNVIDLTKSSDLILGKSGLIEIKGEFFLIPGELDRNTSLNFSDYLMVMKAINTGSQDSMFDINFDGKVNIEDQKIVSEYTRFLFHSESVNIQQ